MNTRNLQALRTARLVAAALIAFAVVRAAPAQEFSGCGEIVQHLNCVLFQVDDTNYLLDDLGGFDVGDEIHVEGTIFSCFSFCFVDCIETTSVSACPPDCAPADLNCDGSVGVPDLLLLLADWGPCVDCGPGECPADLNGDCNVGVADLLILLANWG